MRNTTSNTVVKPRYLVTGANGQLGKEIRDLARDLHDIEFFFQAREDMPLENFEMIRTVFHTVKPDVLINCAAYTAVDKAESEREIAFQVNGEAVGVMAALCAAQGTRFIHISTDYVFNGQGTRPYLETDPTSPVNAYGASKLEGEKQAFRFDPAAAVVRTSWVYSAHGKNFVKTMLRLMGERNELKVVADQHGCPTYARDLANFVLQLAAVKAWEGGIWQFSNSGETTWFEFAKAIGEMAGSGCSIHPISTNEFPTPAKRPAYSVMNTAKAASLMGSAPRHWKEALRDCMARISPDN
jgi:dTDP-4-dehydrorhamnose reductase